MTRKNDDTAFDLLASMIQRIYRHRPGNEEVAAVLDTLDALFPREKYKMRPVLIRSKPMSAGVCFQFNLPPGFCPSDFEKKREYFETALNAGVEFEWDRGYLFMIAKTTKIPNEVDYSWNPEEFKKYHLPIPVGLSRKGLLEVFDLIDAPHLLVGGSPGWGKSNFIRVLIHTLLSVKAHVIVIDFKGVDFLHIEDHAWVIYEESVALAALKWLDAERVRRRNILRKHRASKVQNCKEKLPYIVCVIDEYAEIQSDEIMFYINKLVRLARSMGIHLVACTQRPSVKVIDGDTRDLFTARMAYHSDNFEMAKIILGTSEAANKALELPPIKGRGLFKFGSKMEEVQTHKLDDNLAKAHIRTITPNRWWTDIDALREDEPAVQRLLP